MTTDKLDNLIGEGFHVEGTEAPAMKRTRLYPLIFLLLAALIEPVAVLGFASVQANNLAIPRPLGIDKDPSPLELPAFRLTKQITHEPSASPTSAGETGRLAPMQTRSWTVLIYICADNDLVDFAFSDVNSMELVGSTDDVNIIVYVDFAPNSAPFTGAKCYNITYDEDMDNINSPELATGLPIEPNMGDPTVLLNFIVYGQTYAPADNYLLILWDHGGGYYGVCLDEDSSDILRPSELDSVLGSGSIQRIDVVAFDACLMGQLEVAYSIRSHTDYIVFSEESIPGTGYPYEDILSDLVNNPGTTPQQLANNLVSCYAEAYALGGRYYDPGTTDICLSAIDASSVGQVATALDDFAQSLLPLSNILLHYEELCLARAGTQSFEWPDFVDLGGFAGQVATVISDPTIQSAAQSLQTQCITSVIAEGHLTGVPGATGMSVTFNRYSPSITVDLADDTQWDEFMEAFLNVGGSTETFLQISGEGTYYGYLEGEGDVFRFMLVPSTSFTANIALESLQNGDEDFDLYLLDSTGTVLASSTDPDSSEAIQYGLVAGNTYYVHVESYESGDIDFGLGVFRLTIGQGMLMSDILALVIAVLIVIAVLVLIVLLVTCLVRRRRRPEELPHYPPPAVPPTLPPGPEQPPGVGVKFCPYCGSAIPPGAAYCPICGGRVA